MFDKYTKMVEAYHYAEDSVRGNIEDFTSLRSDIGTVYRDYALKLIDIYGDSIKMVSQAWSLRTRLFDFSILRMLSARERVIAIGNPSGTAITIRVTAIMKYFSTISAI